MTTAITDRFRAVREQTRAELAATPAEPVRAIDPYAASLNDYLRDESIPEEDRANMRVTVGMLLRWAKANRA